MDTAPISSDYKNAADKIADRTTQI